jgi:hypothetical protein
MVMITQRLNQPWVRAVMMGITGAAIVTGIFILAGGRVSQRVFLVPLIYAGAIAVGSALVLPWVERCETRLTPIARRVVVAITFVGIATLGALAAGGVVLATGLVPTERSRSVMTSGLGLRSWWPRCSSLPPSTYPRARRPSRKAASLDPPGMAVLRSATRCGCPATCASAANGARRRARASMRAAGCKFTPGSLFPDSRRACV